MIVAAPITHDADRANGEKHREGLAHLVVEILAAQLLDEDRVRAAQQVRKGLVDLAENANPQAGTGKGMPSHHLHRQAQREAEIANLILEQIPPWLEPAQAHGAE